MNAPALINTDAATPLVMVPIMGDRMSPRLRHGIDAVYYTPSRFLADDMYALDFGDGTPMIRYVQSAGREKGYRLFGECKHYPDDYVSREQLERMMLGIVVCEIKVRNYEQFRQALAGEAIR